MPSSRDNQQILIDLEEDSQAITEKSGSNLAFSFIALPKEKQQAMSSFYAFCRIADDIVDDKSIPVDERADRINAWRSEIEACYHGAPVTTLGRELQVLIKRWLIPPEPFFEILAGVEMDLTQSRYETFEELERYCYRVASAVGLVSIEIFEYENPNAREYAIALGMAFQLTNILRDIGYDLKEYDRVYVPQEELRKFGLDDEDLRSPQTSPARQRLLHLQYHRACHYFHKAARLFPHESRSNFIASEVMTEIYYGLLKKLRKQHFPIGVEPTRLAKFEKIWYLLNAYYRRGARINNQFRSPPLKVAVMGGGFAGMSAALHLSREGHEVHLHEAKAYIGGRAHSFTEPKYGLHLDNGQHIMMGCYHHCLELVDLLHVRDRLDCPDAMVVPYHNRDGRVSILDSGKFPPPFHLLGALCTFNEVNWKDRLMMITFAIAVRLGARPSEHETVSEWLQRHHQTPQAIRALWEPFCIAALNEPVADASASLLHAVLVRSLFGGKHDSSIYIAKVGLSELFMPEVEHCLAATGGSLNSGSGVKTLSFEEQRVAAATNAKGERIEADEFVCAMPWKALKALLPDSDPLKEQLAQIPSSPILALHILCDVEISPEMFVGLLDAKIDWIFNRTSQLEPGDQRYLFSIIISAAYPFTKLSAKELETQMWEEINEFFPHTRGGRIEHSVIYKSIDATFAARPATEPQRAGTGTAWQNMHLAGDWTDTGLPGTLEGAALSGKRIAKILR
ncbi:MAG: hydroxysqualene dehydroxylase HpnE [Verrucomicrobiota bacterium]